MGSAAVGPNGRSAAVSGVLTGPAVQTGRGGLFDRTEPQTGSCVWGVDPSTLRVAIAVAGRGVQTHSFTKAPARSGERLRIIHEETLAFARELAVGCPPVRVFVEAPAGKFVEPQMFYAVGCIQAALACVAPIQLVTVAAWKKRSVGYGLAKKDDVMRWARRQGYGGGLQDEADAWAIAAAGVRLLEPDPEQLELG